MASFVEAPTNFYLGRRYDPNERKLTDDVVYYDSRDLVTHAVVVGMTGSGKTGLCISMLEEAIIDRLPAIIIDPKGDITNLLLNFPGLQPKDFEPWVNVDEALRSGKTASEFAEMEANKWRKGLGEWGIVPERLELLRRIAEFSIYTPGSDAGLPVSVLSSFEAPRNGSWDTDSEAYREEIKAIANALFTLINKDPESLAKEHALLSNILENAWRQGRDLRLDDLIAQVQQPPFDKLGVMPINEYISEKARYKLAMELNTIAASPTYKAWTSGEPIDIQKLMYQPNRRPRVSIFYIAHLNDSERVFFMTLLLEKLISWMRKQSGTTSLRALLYIDELFGFFPPYPYNPPTKEPLMTLLKQARAYGLGLLLATQNPADLDYKGLSNAGTWFIGRLTSDNDKERVMSGLEAMATANNDASLREISRWVSDLPSRVFLMRNLHDEEPVLVHSRWAMSYLRGPLTRPQIQTLMANQRSQLLARMAAEAAQRRPASLPGAMPGTAGIPGAPPSMPGSLPGAAPTFAATAHAAQAAVPEQRVQNVPRGFNDSPPPVPSKIAQYYLPVAINAVMAVQTWQQRTGSPANLQTQPVLAYYPALFAHADVRFQDQKSQMFTARSYAFHVRDVPQAGMIMWEKHQAPLVDPAQINGTPIMPAIFADVPAPLLEPTRFTALRNEIVDMLYATVRVAVPFYPELKLYGSPDESLEQVQMRAQQIAREIRDAEVEKLTTKYGQQIDQLEERLGRHEREEKYRRQEMRQRGREELFMTGEALGNLFRGQRMAYSLALMNRAKRYSGYTKERIDEQRGAQAEVEQRIAALEQDYENEVAKLNDKWMNVINTPEQYLISPYKKDIQLRLLGIGWVPYWYAIVNNQPLLFPALF